MIIRIVKPNAQEVDKERYLRKPAYLKEDTFEVDIREWIGWLEEKGLDEMEIGDVAIQLDKFIRYKLEGK